jgi:hypothetical protein
MKHAFGTKGSIGVPACVSQQEANLGAMEEIRLPETWKLAL